MEIFNGYEYNDCGVCINPDRPYRFGNDHYFYFEIEVSESSQGWAYGYHWSCGTSGGASPCSPTWKAFSSRSKAIVTCAETLKQNFTGRKAKTFIEELDRIIQVETTSKAQVKQYTIFDYL